MEGNEIGKRERNISTRALMFLSGAAILGYLIGTREPRGEHVAKVQFHLHLMPLIAVIVLVTYAYR